MTAAGDQDNELKERIARVFFSMGHSCHYNVDLVGSSMDGTQIQYTDIDVVGRKFDALLHAEAAIADCKSGHSGTPRERIFWLSGVKARFHAARAYFVKKKVDPSLFLHEFEQLGLSIVSEETLAVLEIASGANTLKACGPVCAGSLVASDTAMRILKEFDAEAYRYLKFAYWFEPPETQIETLLTILKDTGELGLAFPRVRALSLMSASLLALTSKAIGVSPAKRADAVKALASGGMDYQHRKELLTRIHQFTAAEFKKKAGKNWGVAQETFLGFLDPPFAEPLAELVGRILQNPSARVLPQALDIICHEGLLSKKKPDLRPLLTNTTLYEDIARGVGDIVAFAERAGALSPADRKGLLSL